MKKFRPLHSNARDLKDLDFLFAQVAAADRACEQNAKGQHDRASYPDEDPHDLIDHIFAPVTRH
jgi:hypothetical protein